MRIFAAVFFTLILAACAPTPKTSDPLDGFAESSGFFDVYVDADNHKVMARLPEVGEDGVLQRFIYARRLRSGLGSNPVGLDRGWGDGGAIFVFRKMGDKVVIEAENMAYRASSDNPLEKDAVRESFARSFVAAADITPTSGPGIVIDLTEFLTRDALGLVQYLKDSDQGSFTLAKNRSFIDTKNVHVFPDNVEIDAFLTLSSDKPGREVATTAANGQDVTLIQHHSFVRLPEDGFTPLKSDPRSGAIETVHYDYSTPLGKSVETRYARRFRLQKDADGNTIKPIVFYIDNGAPEPVRSALVDGAKWWADAFAAAGYPDGYRVEILPDDAHPLDIRYNVVQWVHRQTRGWSYGGGVADPRTGEMLKGHVNLGSLRVRQDLMIFEGLAGTSKTNTGADDDPVELALDRIRQLSAHEIGHTLGFAHNFAASTYGKGSVMDYPAPDVRVTNGALDFSQTYGVGIGEWDKAATTWLYADMSDAEREAVIADAAARGLKYVADQQGRSIATGHADGSVWDNGADPVASLDEVMNVRRIALEGFGPDRISAGQPQSDLNKVIVPIYLYHRYQMAAATKLIGGMRFDYSVNGSNELAAEIVPPARQRAALQSVLKTVDPKALDLSDRTLSYLTPSLGAYSFADSDRELFRRSAYPAFDTAAAADTAAQLTFSALLNPIRAARLIEFHRRDPAQLGLSEMLDTSRNYVMALPVTGRRGELAKTIQARFALSVMDLGLSDAAPGVKARTDKTLRDMHRQLQAPSSGHGKWLTGRIEAYLNAPAPAAKSVVEAKTLPPGSPIGQDTWGEDCWHC